MDNEFRRHLYKLHPVAPICGSTITPYVVTGYFWLVTCLDCKKTKEFKLNKADYYFECELVRASRMIERV